MKDSDIIAIVALIISVVINFFTLVNTSKINKYNSYSNTITSERIKSLEEFKANSSKLVTILNQALISSDLELSTLTNIGYLSKKLSYQLNIKDINEMKLAITLKKCDLMTQIFYLWTNGNEISIKNLKKIFETNENILRENFLVLYNSQGYWDKYINEKFIENGFKEEFYSTILHLDSLLKNQIKQEWEKSKVEVNRLFKF